MGVIRTSVIVVIIYYRHLPVIHQMLKKFPPRKRINEGHYHGTVVIITSGTFVQLQHHQMLHRLLGPQQQNPTARASNVSPPYTEHDLARHQAGKSRDSDEIVLPNHDYIGREEFIRLQCFVLCPVYVPEADVQSYRLHCLANLAHRLLCCKLLAAFRHE